MSKVLSKLVLLRKKITRRLHSLLSHPKAKVSLLAGLAIPLIALSVYLVLVALSGPRSPSLRSGSGDSLYSASNDIYRVDIGKKDGSSDVSFSVGKAKASFVLAGIDKTKARKKGKSVTFPSVQAGVDLRYTTTPNGLKEELILAKPSTNTGSNSNVFLFDLSLSGVVPSTLTSVKSQLQDSSSLSLSSTLFARRFVFHLS